MTDTTLAPLFSADAARRLDAVDRVADTADARYALRALLVSDRDARVRARAAAKLGRAGAPTLAGVLVEAAERDPFPLVREAAWRSLARRAPAEALGAARDAISGDPVWWVRTAAVTALAAIAGRRDPTECVAMLRRTLDDPFWRVRHVAVRSIQKLADEHPEIRESVLQWSPRAETEAAAIEFLRRRWYGDDSGDLEPAPLVEPPADPLWDPDPAVVTTRLESAEARPSLSLLVELLADPHEPLRKLAVRRLSARVRERGDLRALRAALCWLEEPRVPRGPEAVVAMLNRMGELAAELAAEVFADPPGEGALVWALRWVAATGSADLAGAIEDGLEDMSPAVREAAIAAAVGTNALDVWSDRLVAMAAADPSASVRVAATDAIARSSGAGEALLDAVVRTTAPPPQRREVARLAAQLRRFDWLHEAAADPDSATRAIAVAALVAAGEAPASLIAAALDHADPQIRTAALSGDLDRAAALAVSDPDPRARRAAVETLARANKYPADRIEALAADPDPGVRVRLCRLLDPGRDADLRTLLALSFDRELMVRAAAADPLERASDDLVRRLLEDEDDETVRKAAYTFLSRELDEEAAAALVAAHAGETTEVRRHIEAIAVALPKDAGLPMPERRVRAPRIRQVEIREVARRPLGTTGLEVAPLALSGAKDLVTQGFDRALEAGVNLYFWEPRYLTLGRFLRRPRVRDHVHVIAGSYHGTPDAVEADVDTALRRLRRDRIDVFLLFWVRSAARLSDEIFERLARLKDAGKIGAAGFSTHHRELAEEAIAARPWDVVMTRHSAAHPGAERSLLGAARERGVGVLGFSALCYGRLLQPSPRHAAPDAADCYRYSLSQPIDAVISAPSRYRELRENLEVLDRPRLDDAALEALRDHGRWVHAQSADFGALVRRTPRELPRHTADHLAAILESVDRR